MESITDVGVDWLTLTIKAGEPCYRRALTLGALEMQLIAHEGHAVKSAVDLGYYGFRVPHLFVGQREDGMMIRTGGHIAKRIARTFKERAIRSGCSRLDFQITTKATQRQRGRVASLRDCIRDSSGAIKGGRQTTTSTIESDSRGSSFSLGSRRSNCFTRIYDKTAEQRGKVDKNLWRWEVEFKGRAAALAWHQVHTCDDVEALAASYVIGALLKYGLVQEWFNSPLQAREMHYWNPTDDERRLKWLNDTVAATLRKLIASGRGAEAHEALGIESAAVDANCRQSL